MNIRKLASNTILLYVRQMFVLSLNLVAIRIVLKVLGVEDYGVFTVIGALALAFGFLSSSLAAVTQRYLSHAIGSDEKEKLNKIFNSCLQLYVMVAFLLIILAETIGMWVLNTYLNVPIDRLDAAIILYHCSALTFVLTILATPYAALLISYEEMGIYGFVSVIESILKLVSVFALAYIEYDNLIMYGLLLVIVATINLGIFWKICRRKFEMYYLIWFFDKKILSDIVGFTSWTLIGNIASIIKIQGVNVLINIFFGSITTASSAIAIQVNYAVLSLIQNLAMAFKPEVFKKNAQGKIDEVINLTFLSSKFSFYIIAATTLPLQIELSFIFNNWLTVVPEHSITFTRIIMFGALFEAISYPLMTLSQASGDIKRYQIIVGGISIMILPISLLTLQYYPHPQMIFYIGAGLSILNYFIRILIVFKQFNISIYKYLRKVLIPCTIALGIGSIFPFFLGINANDTVLEVVITIFLSFISVTIFMFYIGLEHSERIYIVHALRSKIRSKK